MKKQFLVLFLLVICTFYLKAQAKFEFNGSSHIIKLDSSWKFFPKDNYQYKESNYDDSKWFNVKSTLPEQDQIKTNFKGIGWFRLKFNLDSLLDSIPLCFYLEQEGASEIYLDGKLLGTFGKIGTNEENEERYSPQSEMIFFKPKYNKEMVIAVRYSNYAYDHTYDNAGFRQAGFKLKLDNAYDRFETINSSTLGSSEFGIGGFMFFFTLSIIHFLLWIFYRARRSNLFYSVFSLFFGYFFLHNFLTSIIDNPGTVDLLNLFLIIIIPISFISLLVLLYSLFYEKFPKQLWVFTGFGLLSSVSLVFRWDFSMVIASLLVLGSFVEVLRVVFVAIRKKKRGSSIIGAGFGFLAVFFISMVLITVISGGFSLDDESTMQYVFLAFFALSIISIPLSMSIFLAWDFSSTNKSLQNKLIEVEELSNKNLEQQKEKQKILETQKETLEQQVKERTQEINSQKIEIENKAEQLADKQKEILDSIAYAKRLQEAILPTKQLMAELFKENFILYLPKDIIAGDFYWIHKTKDSVYLAVADCTGHGVPGALVSIVCSNALNRAVKEFNCVSPGQILDKTRQLVIETFISENGEEVKDGMDISLLKFNLNDKNKIEWAGANNPLWYFNEKKEFFEIKPNKQPIGKYAEEKPFTTHVLQLNVGTQLFLFTDGYADQFGGPKGKKFKYKQLFTELNNNLNTTKAEQKNNLEKAFVNWKGNLEQIDDVCIIGVTI